MKKIITLFSLLFLITITFIGCTSKLQVEKPVTIAEEFGKNLYTADSQKIADYKKIMASISEQTNYLKMIQTFDKTIQPLMTKEAYENCLANRYNTLSALICAKGNYTVQVTNFILGKNLYSEKEDKVGYYYEAKLKFTATNGKVERTDTSKGYIGLSKQNSQWKVSIYKLTEAPKLYNEIMIKDTKK